MRPAARAALGLAACLAWYGFGAEPVSVAIESLRPPPRGQTTLQDLTDGGGLLALPASARPLVAEAQALAVREDAWGDLVASLLTPAERAEGLTLAGAEPPARAAPGMTIEPEIPLLVTAILDRYGPRTLPAPAVPRRELWPMVDRRSRARAFAALIRGPGLDEERAAIVLGATLDLLDTQSRRTALEAELAELTR